MESFIDWEAIARNVDIPEGHHLRIQGVEGVHADATWIWYSESTEEE